MGPEERFLKALEDVKDAASFILEVTEGKTLGDYPGHRLLRQAVVQLAGYRGFSPKALAGSRALVSWWLLAGRMRPYDFRKTLVGDLLGGTGDLSMMQQLAGHTNYGTIICYDRRRKWAKGKVASHPPVPYFEEDD